MNSPDDDRDLRESFASLRREEQGEVTDFRRLFGAAGTRRARQGRTALAPVALAVTVLLALGLVIGQALHLSDSRAPHGAEPPASLAGWTAPTDFLLRTPGHVFLSTSPAFALGVPTLDSGAPARQPIHPPTPPK